MKKILIAEDNAVNRELLRELLEMRGYVVIEACDGQEALRKIAETQPDILLLDLGMPVLDGFGTVCKIRENPNLSALPVLAVTAYAMRGDREKILNSGFNGYLSKPINPSALDQELERLLNKDGAKSVFGSRLDAAPPDRRPTLNNRGGDLPVPTVEN
jgi:CheY-like chemotaxis protein